MRFAILTISVILGVAIQATWLAQLNLPGQVVPDLILILVISYGLLRGPDEGLLFGLAAGFFLNLHSGGIIGIEALSKMMAGYCAGLLEKNIFKDNLLVPVVAVLAGTLIFNSFSGLMYIAFKANYNLWGMFISNILPQTAYNAVLAPLVYYFLFKSEHFISEQSNS
ncbi:rod shape-determining protein MreD [Hydrogenispora ethanolica]|jgi:rod shape-determining protein MreD|uniref:Rod shape-determining protein MreD n=1 Tax=Hydrogenispora ethanolica TaxID=1082276 RepID=A0A4R1RWW8_HYDET|nr:rod shape-determining protein MreD [Hydrogenispora ethanolica]TCL70954.1 rod shape-determining protein MreD [Hydrogenispora ethanolica]